MHGLGEFGDLAVDDIQRFFALVAGVRGEPDAVGGHPERGGDLGRVRTGALRQLAYLAGDDRKALARLACVGGLDGGVHGQEVGLAGDVVNYVDHLHHRVRVLGDLDDHRIGLLHLVAAVPYHVDQVVDRCGTGVGYARDIGHRSHDLFDGGARTFDGLELAVDEDGQVADRAHDLLDGRG